MHALRARAVGRGRRCESPRSPVCMRMAESLRISVDTVVLSTYWPPCRAALACMLRGWEASFTSSTSSARLPRLQGKTSSTGLVIWRHRLRSVSGEGCRGVERALNLNCELILCWARRAFG